MASEDTGTCRARATGPPRRAAGPLSSLVVELHEQGMTAKDIARRLQLSDRTVHRWLAAGSFQYKSSRRKRQSPFDPFAPSVLSRWSHGESNGHTLWGELQKQGHDGSER